MRTSLSLLALAATLLLAGCSCDQNTVKRSPTIEVIDAMGADRTTVDFGKVQLTTTGTQQVRIRNSGAATLTISKADFSQPKFGLGTALPFTVEAAGDVMFPLTFTPTVADQHETGTVTLSTDDPQHPTVELSLLGTGVTAVALLQPTTLAFGDVFQGETKTLSLSLINTGSNDLPVTDATLTGLPASVTGDLTPLKQAVPAGGTSTAMLTFAPPMLDTLNGSLDIVLGGTLGTLTVPVTGRGVSAVPRLCFKFNDSAMEQCTTTGMDFLGLSAGSLCDAKLYPPDGGPSPCVSPDGGAAPYSRSGLMYVRNEGNTKVAYTMSYASQAGPKCDAGSTVDFEFGNAPDSGVTTWNVATASLPVALTDPMPWETAPIAVTYRARSGCREDAADQAHVIWTRQEPAGVVRLPGSLILNLSGQSQLPRGVPQDVVFNQVSVPVSAPFVGIANTGDAPLHVLAVNLHPALLDGGAGYEPASCASSSVGGCPFFSFSAPLALPTTLPGTLGMPTSATLGSLVFGAASGPAPMRGTPYTVYAVITTNDPYSPAVAAKLKGTAQ
jgi:hypothetical protein